MLDLRGVSRSKVGQMLHPGYPAGTFTWMGSRVAANTIGSADNLRLYPFQLAQRRRVSAIYTWTQTGGAASALKCAVWRNDYSIARPTGLPVLGQNSGFDTTAAGTDGAAIADIWLDEGIWWSGEVHTGTAPTMNAMGNADPISMIAMPSNAANAASGWLIAQPYAGDIMALDLTGATLAVTSAPIAAIGLGWS